MATMVLGTLNLAGLESKKAEVKKRHDAHFQHKVLPRAHILALQETLLMPTKVIS
jgi:hypothetical protein